MATHTIRYRDWRHDEPPTIVWNDETGEVAGDYDGVPNIRRRLELAEREGHLLGEEGGLHLRDPRHDPADFLALLGWQSSLFYEHLELPPALRAVKPTPIRRPPRMPPGVVT